LSVETPSLDQIYNKYFENVSGGRYAA